VAKHIRVGIGALALGVVLALVLFISPMASAQGAGWPKWRAITISGTHPENYQLKVILPFYDSSIRFTENLHPENISIGALSYWIENYTADNMTVWVKRAVASSAADNAIFVYYGNASAGNQSSGDNTFVYWKDSGFTTDWTIVSGTFSESNGILTSTSASANIIRNSNTLGTGYVYESLLRASASTEDLGPGFIHGWVDANNYYREIMWSYQEAGLYLTQVVTGSATNLIGTNWARNTNWHILGVSWENSTALTLYFDYDNKGYTNAASSSITSGYQGFRMWQANQQADWYRVRKWVSPAPTTSVGSEWGYPTQPSLLAPDNNANTPNPVTFTWTRGTYTDNHRIEIWRYTPGFGWGISPIENVVISSPNDNTWTFDFTTVGENYTYEFNHRWKVFAQNAYGENGTNYRYFIVTFPPTQPSLLAPDNNATYYITTLTKSVTFTWTRGNSADNHRIEVFKNNGGWILQDNVTISPPNDNTWSKSYGIGSYKWRVIAHNNDGENMSIERFFTIVAVFPTMPQLLKPDNNSSSYEACPNFTWIRGDNADNHRIEVFENVSGSWILIDNVTINPPIDNTWHKPPTGYTLGLYRWRVVAHNYQGENLSGYFYFTVLDQWTKISTVSLVDVGNSIVTWTATGQTIMVAASGSAQHIDEITVVVYLNHTYADNGQHAADNVRVSLNLYDPANALVLSIAYYDWTEYAGQLMPSGTWIIVCDYSTSLDLTLGTWKATTNYQRWDTATSTWVAVEDWTDYASVSIPTPTSAVATAIICLCFVFAPGLMLTPPLGWRGFMLGLAIGTVLGIIAGVIPMWILALVTMAILLYAFLKLRGRG